MMYVALITGGFTISLIVVASLLEMIITKLIAVEQKKTLVKVSRSKYLNILYHNSPYGGTK